MREITQQDLLNQFEYFENGILLWKPKISNGRVINYKYSATPAGTCLDKDGYGKVTLTIDGKKISCRLHRLIFMYHHGYMPEAVDHIDRNIFNNRIENLRAANKNQNQWNRGDKVKSKSGVRGVVMKGGRWYAQCKVFGKRHHLGIYKSIEEAAIAVNEFRKQHHGEFANG